MARRLSRARCTAARPAARRLCGVGLGIALLAAAAGARADATQLCRAFTTLALAPTDVALAPVIATRDLAHGLSAAPGDPLWARVALAPPGWLWLNGLQVLGGMTRSLGGLWDLVPGLLRLGRPGTEPPRYAAARFGRALYQADWGPCPVQIGLSHQDLPLR